MSDQIQQKCPACDAPMRFDPATGKMVCDYCGTVVDITPASAESEDGGKTEGKKKKGSRKAKDVASEVQGIDFDVYNAQVTSEQAAALPIYSCVSCGAEVIAAPEQMALTCPYCGNNIVLTNKASGKLRPDGLIPFALTPDILPGAVSRFYKGKKLLPKGFFSNSTIGKVTGVYVPFWVFSGRMSGRMYFTGQHSSSSRKGDYVYTTVETYRLTRDVDMRFADIPADASGKVDDALMDSLEPFRTDEARPFDIRYLAGFTADRFDQKKSRMADRVKKRMNASADSVVTSRAGMGYSSVHHDGGSLTADMGARYLLFPVYMFDVSHDGKDYHFAVNGQTGRVVGNLPIDKKVSIIYFLIRFGIVSGVLVLWSLLKYFCGY